MNQTTERLGPPMPEGADSLEEAVLAAIRDLRDKGRPVATYCQIAHHSAVADWQEARGCPWTAYGIIPALSALCDRGLLGPTPDGWRLADG